MSIMSPGQLQVDPRRRLSRGSWLSAEKHTQTPEIGNEQLGLEAVNALKLR